MHSLLVMLMLPEFAGWAGADVAGIFSVVFFVTFS
jgi:hypothetical protein